VSARFDLERETPAALVERVRALHPELPVVAVLRGEADTRVRVALLAAGSRGRVPADVLPADRVVVASSLPVTPPVAGLPTLLVGPPNPSAGGEHVVQIEAPAQALLTDRGLPGLVEAWLAP
jgi:hypothetical protein